jgi:predicted GIY-YIG superfamily endonuclease
MFVVNLLGCSDGSFYTGFCHDLDHRLAAHQNGTDVVTRERQVKGRSHARKDALVRGDRDLPKTLSKRRSSTSPSHRRAEPKPGANASRPHPITPAA